MVSFWTVFLFQKVLWERPKAKRGKCVPLWLRPTRRLSLTKMKIWGSLPMTEVYCMFFIVTTLLCFSSLLFVLFLVFGGAMFLGLWVVLMWSSLQILVVKFPGLVGFYRGIQLVFLGFVKGVSGGFLWLVFGVVFLF